MDADYAEAEVPDLDPAALNSEARLRKRFAGGARIRIPDKAAAARAAAKKAVKGPSEVKGRCDTAARPFFFRVSSGRRAAGAVREGTTAATI